MTPVSFSVSEVRVAATCPRITYFDAEHTRRIGLKARSVTRIWKAGGDQTACGTLFHNAVEAFNRLARDAPEVREAFEGDPDPRMIERCLREYLNHRCVDLDALSRRHPDQQQAFIRAVGIYMGELADIVGDALGRGKPASEVLDHLFGDRRRRVDVTFLVGPRGEPVRVVGVLDYVFYDWRTAHHRILDYKLTPAGDPGNDLFQVALYALMHHVQHGTEPDVGVLYLHPERRVVDMTWDQVHGQRHKLYDLLASMAAWVDFNEATGRYLRPPGEPSHCSQCRWDRDGECVRRLGPKLEGLRLARWSDAARSSPTTAEPRAAASHLLGRSGLWSSLSEGPPPSREGEAPAEPQHAAPSRESGSSASGATSRLGGSLALPGLSRTAPQPPVDGESHINASDIALCIGTTSEGGRPAVLPLEVLPTHVAVVGAAGSGKTWMAKVIAEEAVRSGVPVLAVDPQGDLVQFLRPAEERPGLTSEERARRREFLDRVEPRVWTPGSSHGIRLSLDPIRLAGRDELAGISDPARREEEWEGMLATAAAQLVALTRVGGETDSQQTFLFRVLRSLASRARDVDLATIAAAASEPASVGLVDADQFIKKTEREKLARKLNGLRLGPSASLFTGGRRLDLDEIRRPSIAGKTPLNIVYLNALADDDQKHAFVAALAAEVYRWMVTSVDPVPGRPSLLFYIDEARDFIPAGATKPPAKTPLIRLFTQGRKLGLACLLCTQSPRSVDYNVLGNCSTKLIGRLEAAQDIDRVAQWFTLDGPTPRWLAQRKGAEAGSFVGRWPGITPEEEGRAFVSRGLFTHHEGAWSPDRLEREIAEDRAAKA